MTTMKISDSGLAELFWVVVAASATARLKAAIIRPPPPRASDRSVSAQEGHHTPGPLGIGRRSRPGVRSEQGRHLGNEAQMRPGPLRCHATPGSPLNQPLLQEKRLVGVLDRVGLLAHTLGERGEADRPAGETPAERVEDRPVQLVEAEVVDA